MGKVDFVHGQAWLGRIRAAGKVDFLHGRDRRVVSRWCCKTLERVQMIAFGINRYVANFGSPALEPPIVSPKIYRPIWVKNFENISKFVLFCRNSLGNSLSGLAGLARWLARIPATQLARSRLQSSSERGSARFCFHFLARAYVQGTPDARLLKPRHVFRRILPSRAFLFESADSAALPHPGRRIPDRSLSPPRC